MKKYLSLIRIPNLLIIILLQSILYYGILIPALEQQEINSVFSKFQFPLFIFITLLVTASGYIINDILDFDTDKINKPEKLIVDLSMTLKNAMIYYFTLVILGLLLSSWVAIDIEKPLFILLYILPILILYAYSKWLKKTLLTGNIVISLFSAGVPAIILIFELSGLKLLEKVNFTLYSEVITIFYGLIMFSFFVSLYREIVKDIEDVEGDRLISANTLPVKADIETSKFICGVLAIIILILLFYWLRLPLNDAPVKIYAIIAVIFPLSYSVFLLQKAVSKKDFHRLSTVLKLIMLTGILMTVFYI